MMIIEEILKGKSHPDFLVSIVSSSGGVALSSILAEALNINASVDWAGDSLLPDKVNGTVTKGVSTAQKVGITSASGLKVMDTTFRWQGTENQSFSLNLLFSSLGTQSAISSIKDVNKLTSPMSIAGGFYTAPLGYVGGDDKNGLLQVSIGDWFRASNLVCVNNGISIEPVFGEDGKPMFSKTTLNFKAYKLLTASEYNAWFR